MKNLKEKLMNINPYCPLIITILWGIIWISFLSNKMYVFFWPNANALAMGFFVMIAGGISSLIFLSFGIYICIKRNTKYLKYIYVVITTLFCFINLIYCLLFLVGLLHYRS